VAQISVEYLGKLSAPHLKEMKLTKKELLDLYQKLHDEYIKNPPEVTEIADDSED
jgi:hypothetical protein